MTETQMQNEDHFKSGAGCVCLHIYHISSVVYILETQNTTGTNTVYFISCSPFLVELTLRLPYLKPHCSNNIILNVRFYDIFCNYKHQIKRHIVVSPSLIDSFVSFLLTASGIFFKTNHDCHITHLQGFSFCY